MAGGRPKEALVLTEEERGQLERWTRRPKTEDVATFGLAGEDRVGVCRWPQQYDCCRATRRVDADRRKVEKTLSSTAD